MNGRLKLIRKAERRKKQSGKEDIKLQKM